MKQLRKRIAIIMTAALLIPYLKDFVPLLADMTKVQAAGKEYQLETQSGMIGILSTPARIHVKEANGWQSDEKFSFKSADESICSVDNEGYMEGKKKGITKIAVTHKETKSVVGSYQVTVKESEIAKIKDEYSHKICIGEEIGIEKVVDYHGRNIEYKFSSDKPEILDFKSVYIKKSSGDSSIVATAKKAGIVNVTVKQKIKGTYKTLGSIKITVVAAAIPQKIYLAMNEKGNIYDELGFQKVDYRFVENVNKNAEYKFKTSNEKVLQISTEKYNNFYDKTEAERINYETKSVGTAFLEVTEKYNGTIRKLGKIKVIVTLAFLDVKEVTLVNDSLYLAQHILVKNKEAKYLYHSSNKKIATVNEDGLVEQKQQGDAIITVSEETINKDTNKKMVREVGKVKVKVRFAKLNENNTLELGLYELDYIDNYVDKKMTSKILWEDIKCTAVSSDSNIVKIEKHISINEKGEKTTIYGIAANKVGTANITIKASYKGKSIVLGKIRVNVVNKAAKLKWEENHQVITQDHMECNIYLLSQLKYVNKNAKYSFVLDKKSKGKIVNGFYSTKNEGTAKITYYETLNGKKRKVGTLLILVTRQ